MMSGENELSALNPNEKSFSDKKWEDFEKVCNDYLSSIGVNKIRYNVEVDKFLALTINDMRTMTPDEAQEGYYVLSQHALYIQKVLNDNIVKLEWAKHNLHIVLSKEAKNYGNNYSKYDERRDMVLVDNVYAKALNAMILHASARVKHLEFLSGKISSMAKVLGDKSIREKRYGQKEGSF